MDKHGLGLRAPFRAARRSTSCINWVCRSARMPHRRRRFLWANQAWSGAAFSVPVAFRMSANSVPSLVRVLCAVIENETGYRRLSRFPAQSPALQRLAKKNGTWDLAQTRSDDGAEPGGQVGRGSIPGPSPVLPNYSRQEPGPPQKRARLRPFVTALIYIAADADGPSPELPPPTNEQYTMPRSSEQHSLTTHRTHDYQLCRASSSGGNTSLTPRLRLLGQPA